MKAALPTIAEELELIVAAATKGGALALPYFNGDMDLDVKFKEGNSPVSAADFAVNQYLHDTLRSERPTYGWLSEETEDNGDRYRQSAPRTFVVDPIDGTRGFIEGSSMWCVSIAVVENGIAIAGVLFCPSRNEIFAASKNSGATINGSALSIASNLPDTIIMGGPRIFLDRLDSVVDDEFLRHPHVPSLAYRIALVAMGRMHGTFVKPNAHDWDIAAAGLILSEAGGHLWDNEGNMPQLNLQSPVKPVMIAAHANLSDQMLAIVQQTPFG